MKVFFCGCAVIFFFVSSAFAAPEYWYDHCDRHEEDGFGYGHACTPDDYRERGSCYIDAVGYGGKLTWWARNDYLKMRSTARTECFKYLGHAEVIANRVNSVTAETDAVTCVAVWGETVRLSCEEMQEGKKEIGGCTFTRVIPRENRLSTFLKKYWKILMGSLLGVPVFVGLIFWWVRRRRKRLSS